MRWHRQFPLCTGRPGCESKKAHNLNKGGARHWVQNCFHDFLNAESAVQNWSSFKSKIRTSEKFPGKSISRCPPKLAGVDKPRQRGDCPLVPRHDWLEENLLL